MNNKQGLEKEDEMPQKRIDDPSKGLKKADFQGRILKVLVYFASDMGRIKLPTIEQFVLSEVVAATIEYLTGDEYLFTYRRTQDGKELPGVADGWEWRTNEAMVQALEQFGSKLNPSLREAIKELTHLEFYSDGIMTKGYLNMIYTTFKHAICHSWLISTFSLSVEFIEEVRRSVIPSLNPETLRHCQTIAEIMKGYVERDVDLIKRRYHW